LTQGLLYRPPIERELSDERSSDRLDTILADRNSDCHQRHEFALPLPMPLVGFRGALRVGDRGTVPRGRSGGGGAVLGSAETRAPSHGWRRAPRKRPGVGRYRYRPDRISRRRPWRTRRPQLRSGISRRRPAWRRVALKGDRLRPLRSAQAVAVHQDGIAGHGHPVERCRFLPGPSEIRRCAGRGERQGFCR
jgi:hypothetical protein